MVGENAGITGDFSPFTLEFILIRQSKHVDRPWLCCESNELIFECLLKYSPNEVSVQTEGLSVR